MRKHIHVLAAIATLLAGSAFAQATDPRFTGTQPGYQYPERGPQAYGNSGWTPEQAYGYNGYGYNGYGAPLGGVLLSDGRWVVPDYQSQYPRTSRDRDGDGVRNSRDRYPDDPRYR